MSGVCMLYQHVPNCTMRVLQLALCTCESEMAFKMASEGKVEIVLRRLRLFIANVIRSTK